MRIHIDDLTFDAIIGILESERHTPQRVRVTCKIDYAYTADTFIDYAVVAQTIQSTIIETEFELLESAIETLGTVLKTRFPLIQSLYLKIEKPDILPQATVGISHTFTFNS